MDNPASYYGKLAKRNPVITVFERDINSFMTLMKRVASSSSKDNSDLYVRGIKLLVDIWKKFKHRLPPKMYDERMLQVADFLFGIKLYQLALWQGYSHHLQQFNSVTITDITSVDHFMASFFPEGFDTDQDVFALKIRAMQGCAMCLFELEKRHSVLRQDGLSKLLRVLNFTRIMMQALQQHEHLCWHMYNGSIHIYTICRYLMTMNYSSQALEYLLWASISLELSVPLMTVKYLSWIVTLYCAVCHCYYDNQAAVQAEKFARRALGKINELAEFEGQSQVPAARETQRAYKEASIKLGAMMFKRAVHETKRKAKFGVKVKPKTSLKDVPNVPWPRDPTERLLMAKFDSSAAQFFCILEALWDSTTHLLQKRMPEEPELVEVIVELLSAGISILSGVATTKEQKSDSQPRGCLSALTPTSTLMDLAITGENKVPVMSAVRFIKLLFLYKQPDAFTELSREMLQVLSGLQGVSFRKAEIELALLNGFNNLMSSERSRPKDSNITDDSQKASLSMSDEFVYLVDTLHKSACGSALEVQPDEDLVLDVMLFLWGRVKVVMQRDIIANPDLADYLEKADKDNKWLWSLSRLCELAFVHDLATVDCITMTEMIHTLVVLLESAAERSNKTPHPEAPEAVCGGVSFALPETTSTELLQKVCEMARRGFTALAKGIATLMPPDSSAITDSVFMQKCCPLPPLSSRLSSETWSEKGDEDDEISEKEKEQMETKTESDIKDSRDDSSTSLLLLAKDLHQKLDIIYHRACLKLLQLNAVAESELMDRIKKNKVSRALLLIQKALLLYNSMEIDKSRKTKNLLEEASSLIEKAEVEERRLYISTISKTPAEDLDKGQNEEEENPPSPPILLSRTDHALTFAPAPYKLEGQVCWYQLCGLAVDGINRKVRLRDCFLPGTGILVPAGSSECVLRVEGLVPNQKYIFAVAAYDSQGTLLGNSIGRATFPLLASMPVPLLSTWAHLAQVAFQAEQYTIAKRACSELWSHFTLPDPGSRSSHDNTVTTRLREQTLELSSPHLRKLFLISIFIETEINIQQGSLLYGCKNGPFIWEQEVRLAECERVLVAMDLALYLEDGLAAVQAVVSCYGLLAPLIFHQIPCKPAVQVLKKCLIVLENSDRLKKKWTRNISEALMHMIACITYYLSKACLALREPPMAGSMIDSGRRLLKEVYEVQLQIRRVPNEACPDRATVKFERKSSLQLKALHVKNKKIIPSQAATSTDNENSSPMTSSEDPTIFYEVIFYSPLRYAYENVMRVRRKAYFPEYAALLLQRTLKEGCPDLVLKWGQSMFEYLARRDKVILEALEGNGHNKSVQVSKGNESPQNRNTSKEDTRNKLKQKKLHSMFQRVITNRELQAVENLLTTMSSVVQRRMKQLKLRNLYCEERVWKSHINYSMAKAHLALFYQGLDQLHGNTLQQRFSQLNPLYFSLAYSGVLVRRNSQQQPSTEYGIVSERDSSHPVVRVHGAACTDKDEAVRVDKIAKEENCEEQETSSKTAEQQIEKKRRTASMMLDSISKSALHLKRAMVLAHRGSHWTTLQHVCHTVWNQSCRIASLAQTAAHLESDSPLTAEQLHTTITQLLSLATDLIMDMLNSLGLWSLYDSDLTEEELGSSLHFSASLDDSTHVDLRWVCTLVLHTLERLHDCGKWESLAHFALLFNSYTRERYVSITTPLLVHAQRRLLERISCFGGPAAPQPHHARTQKVTGEKVTYRSYAGCQLLCGWTPHHAQQPPSHINSETTNASRQEAAELKDAEMQSSMSLVCVPLDIEDTLSCYHQAFERRPDCLRVFQHSRSLLMRLLANTQPCFAAQMQSHSENQVNFNPNVMPPPSIQPCELTDEDYSNPDVLYGLPISADHLPTVTAAYSSSIKYLQANSKDSLRIQALHEMGNLHFYNGNIRAAHSSWSKAVDCALQSSGAVEKWDGLSFGGCSLQETLKQAGIWGCLQAAVLTAKIAQHILTSDIRQRTKYCLLSAHLFKCLLCCSLTQPRDDLLYASYSIGDELLPGVDLFSEPHRVHLATTVTSLNFICHWLFTIGYWITLLPMLAIYLHFVGTVCRDVQRVVAGKILKIHALTELCLYTEAVKEAGQLTQGIGILLPDGRHIAKDEDHQPMKTFYSNKSVMENAESLAELMNCHCAPVVRKLYGSTLCLRFNLARVQLVLALTNTIPGPSVSDTAVSEACASGTNVSINSKSSEQKTDAESHRPKTEEIKVLDLDTDKMLTPGSMKFLLLEGVSTLLQSMSQQLTLQGRSETENLELAIQTNLLKANHYLQQGHVELSSQMVVSSLALLQTSPGRSIFDSKNAEPELPHPRTGSEQGTKDFVSNTLHGDCPRAIEASEKIGVSLWLRCRLALVCSLTAQSCGTAALFSGKNINGEAARLLQEGLNECALWGDTENQALLMVEAAELEAQRGNTDDSMALLQEVVSLLSGRPCIPPRSCMTLARATLLFSELKSAESTALLKVAQKLLQNQLCVFGENVVLEDGNVCFPPPGPCNIYLPYRSILDQITLQITKCIT